MSVALRVSFSNRKKTTVSNTGAGLSHAMKNGVQYHACSVETRNIQRTCLGCVRYVIKTRAFVFPPRLEHCLLLLFAIVAAETRAGGELIPNVRQLLVHALLNTIEKHERRDTAFKKKRHVVRRTQLESKQAQMVQG